MNSDKKRIIITGATSFIGSYIVKEFIKNGHHVTAIVRPNSFNLTRLEKHPSLCIVELDIDEIEKLDSIIGKQQYDLFYHLAWEGIRGDDRDNEQLQQKNYRNAIKAMQVASKLECKAFIGAGSQAEYGHCKGEITETYQAIPTTQYGKAKLETYTKLSEIAQQSDMRIIWTRIFSVYGVYDYNKTLIMTLINKMLNNEPIELTECIQMWDYIYVEDVAEMMYLLGMSNAAHGIYNIASGDSRPLKEFVMQIKAQLNSTSELKFGAIPYGDNGIINIQPNVKKIQEELNWKCKVDFREGINRILQFMNEG